MHPLRCTWDSLPSLIDGRRHAPCASSLFLPCSVSGLDPVGSAGQKAHQFLSEAQTDPVGTDSHLGKISGLVDTRCQRDC